MPNITCELNSNYEKALKLPNIKWTTEAKRMMDFCSRRRVTRYLQGLGMKGKFFISQSEFERAHCPLRCCGISEVHLEPLNGIKPHVENLDCFDELIAKYIDIAVGNEDRRIVVIGVPTEVGQNSQYRLSFYQALRKTLRKFGFIELQDEPYKNKHSGNKITVMAGQLPELNNLPNLVPDDEEDDDV